MTTVATAAQLFRLTYNVPLLHIPNYGIPGRYWSSKPEMFHNLSSSRLRKINRTLMDGLAYIHLTLYLLEQENNVAKSKRAPVRDGMPEMISFKLRVDELVEFEAWQAKVKKPINELMSEVLLSGVKIGVSWDAYNDCFICSLTPKDEQNKNTGKCLLSRSVEWEEAFLLNYYKADVLFTGGLWTERDGDNQRG